MGIPKTRRKTVRPIHPGEMLREDVLPDYGLTVSGFAHALGVSRQTVNELLRRCACRGHGRISYCSSREADV